MEIDGLRGRRYFYGMDNAMFVEFEDTDPAGRTA